DICARKEAEMREIRRVDGESARTACVSSVWQQQTESGSFAFVVPELPAEPFFAIAFALRWRIAWTDRQRHVSDALVGALPQIMVQVFVHQVTQVFFSKYH